MLPSCRRTRKVNSFAVPLHGRLQTSAPVTGQEPRRPLGAIPLAVSDSSEDLADANLNIQRSGLGLRIQPRGSSRQGRRTVGAVALWRNLRAGVGRQGNAYAIPTKDHQLRVLPLHVIRAHVGEFLNCARRQPNIGFELTPIGCGLAGYRPEQIAPMFSDAPPIVILPNAFDTVLAAGSSES